jgi:hypothetical protein
MRHLACFFKSPEGVEDNDFFRQFDLLVQHLARSRPRASARIPRTTEH